MSDEGAFCNVTLQKCSQNTQPQNEFCVQWGLGHSTQQAEKWVCINTRIACDKLSIMIGCWILIRHKHTKNQRAKAHRTLTLWFCFDITATPLRQSRLWKNRCSCNVHLVDLMGFEPTTSRMRTERARKVVSFLPTDCGVWSAKNESCSRCFLCKFHLTQRIRF